MKVIQETSRAH